MGRSHVHFTWIFIIFAVLAILGCSTERKKDDIIFIVIDTWRRDYTELMRDSGRFATPFLDQLAAESVVFPRCRSHSSNTNLAMSVLWTGLLPDETGVLTQMSPLPQKLQTLAETFRDHGYQTIGICANPVLQPKKGFAQGFDRYEMTEITGDRVLADLSAFLKEEKKGEGPIFLYAHFMDCHFPYFGTHCAERYGVEDVEIFDRVHRGEAAVEDILFGSGLTEKDISNGHDQYLASICQMDEYIKKMAEMLGDTWKNARIVVTADHGESLGEHEYYFGHSLLTYDVTLRVPLMVKLPGHLGRIEDRWVDHLDLHQTLVAWTGDLVGDLTVANQEDAETPVHLAWGHPNLRQFRGNAFVPKPGRFGARRSAALGPEKLIVIPQIDGSRVLEYYLVDQDPFETHDLGSDGLYQSENADLLLAAVGDGSAVDSVDIDMDDRERERLRSLGYLGD